jgi:glycosyltransferase involved in cell wall biosynthesis
MKIIHIIPNLKKGGAERIVIDIVRALHQKVAMEVKLILFENKIEYDIEDIKNLIEIVPSKVQLSMSKRNSINVSALQKVIEIFHPDIIHSHLFEGEIVSRSCFFPQAKWFTHCHDRMKSFEKFSFFNIRSKRELTNFFEKEFLYKRYQKNGGNHFISISEDIQEYFQIVLPKKLRNVHLLPNAIDVSRFKNEKSGTLNSEVKAISLVSVGRLDSNKNHQFLIDVVADLENRNIPILLSIIGEGVERENLKSKICLQKLESKIKLLGLIHNVETYLRESTVYVHAAITEGFGLTLLEAMASGLPVVTLDGGGNRMLIKQGENGFLVQDNSVKTFSDRIIECISSSEKYHAYSKNAIEFAQEFDINKYIQKLIDIYQKSL